MFAGVSALEIIEPAVTGLNHNNGRTQNFPVFYANRMFIAVRQEPAAGSYP